MSKKTNWVDVFRETANDIMCVIKAPSYKPKQVKYTNSGARIFILLLMVLTLLFSGIGTFSWIILIILFIVLNFV